MRPREQRETGQTDMFRSRLDQIIDLNHPLARLVRTIDWGFVETELGAVYSNGAGQPPLPTRLMAGVAILKSMHNLSDEVVCDRWVENPYFQYFCGEGFFKHRLNCRRWWSTPRCSPRRLPSRPIPSWCTARTRSRCGWPRSTGWSCVSPMSGSASWP